MSVEGTSEMPAHDDLEVAGVAYRRNLFNEWCEVSAESGELHVAYQESDCLDEIERLRDDVAKLLNRCVLLDEEVARQRQVIRAAARDLYVAEIHRQGVGWDDYCTDLLVRSQHALAEERKP